MSCFAVLCGSAPENFRQKKLAAMHDFLRGAAGGSWAERDIVAFPGGVPELMLESVLNNALDEAAEDDGGEVLLYLCALTESDLHAELSGSCRGESVSVVRLGGHEIRREVLAYYVGLAEKMGVKFTVRCDWDCELAPEEALGYEAV